MIVTREQAQLIIVDSVPRDYRVLIGLYENIL